jgi:prephenate dehydrogenase
MNPQIPSRDRQEAVFELQAVAIVGVGLIGGSFGLAIKAAGFSGEVIGVSSHRSIQSALAVSAIDRGASLAEAAEVADLIYLAQPVGRILATLHILNDLVRPDALVTDVGSTKHVIVETARKHLRRCAFLGGHPLAGKESRGVENAEADLFRGRPYVLTPSTAEDLEHPIAQTLRQLLCKIGAEEVILGADEHDRRVAFSSHLPQLASTALASVLSEHEVLAGPGLIGASRLALSAYEIWRDILVTNSNSIADALTVYIQKLEYLRDNLRTRAMQEEFEAAAQFANRLRAG